jgi:hypothetical protein
VIGVAGPRSDAGPPPPADFVARCASPDVVTCIGFDSQDDIAGHVLPAGDGSVDRVVIDPAMRASGAGSLRLDVPANAGSDGSGSLGYNFRDDLTAQFGPGEQFFVQWRQRVSPEMLSDFRTTFGGATSFMSVIVGEGDQPGFPTANTCTELRIGVSKALAFHGPIIDHSCGRFVPLEFYDGAQVRMQHQGPPYCYYPDDPDRGCRPYVPDEWMTFQLGVAIGAWNTPSSRLRFWLAREGQPSELILDSALSHPEGFVLYMNPGAGTGTNPGARYGKVWLMAYITDRDPAIAYPPGSTWFDELIVSRAQIPDPL